MSVKSTAGVVCFIFGATFLFSGIRSIVQAGDVADASGVGVSRAVGPMLPSILFLIVGLWLLRKPSN